MPRKQSPETALREARSRIRHLERALGEWQQGQSLLIRERDEYRGRLTRAEQECAEWKRRFDSLLARIQPQTLRADEKVKE